MRIGWIGTGVMGVSMAGHLQAAGHELFVYNRTQSKTNPLLEKGAVWCASPAEVARQSEVVFSIVGFPLDVEETYFGVEGVLSVEGACKTVVDMTTSEPSLAVKIAEAAEAKGIASLDAPVSGGDIGARNAALAIMVGGNPETFDQVKPLFELMGQNIALMGGAGAGQHTKMCNQVLIASTMIGVCESLLYAAKVGLDEQAVIDIIGQGAAGSWSINNLGPRIAKGDFKSGFFVEHFIKDMDIALKEARARNLALPGLALVHQIYVALQSHGHGRSCTQALMLALQTLNGENG